MEIYFARNIAMAHSLKLGKEHKCSRLHGHTYHVEVWISAEKDEKTGMVVDFEKLKEIVDEFDHRNLNDFLEVPTVENFVELLIDRIRNNAIPKKDCVIRVKVWESENSYAEDIKVFGSKVYQIEFSSKIPVNTSLGDDSLLEQFYR